MSDSGMQKIQAAFLAAVFVFDVALLRSQQY